jgi:hypothetical protein
MWQGVAKIINDAGSNKKRWIINAGIKDAN